MIPLLLTEDVAGRLAVGMRQPDMMDYFKLVAHTGATCVVPTGARHVLFSCSTNFFVRYTSDALTSAVYGSSSSQAAGVARASFGFEQDPQLRSLKDVTGLGIIAPAAGDMTLSWFG